MPGLILPFQNGILPVYSGLVFGLLDCFSCLFRQPVSCALSMSAGRRQYR